MKAKLLLLLKRVLPSLWPRFVEASKGQAAAAAVAAAVPIVASAVTTAFGSCAQV